MDESTVHRGPDDSGSYIDHRIALGMRRLSIIDLDGGHQPISNADGTVWLVCNGEIYNFQELRSELKSLGYPFKTASDSEVLLHAYIHHGMNFIHRIDGMFGFAIWDTTHERLVLGRDRLGIKPLYYYQDAHHLAFASEMKALLPLPFVEKQLDRAALNEYLALGYVPAPLSMFEGIRKLQPGQLLTVENNNVHVRRYWQLPDKQDLETDFATWCTRVRNSLTRAIEQQMVSDVPLGAFLSGGIDSSAVVALMAQLSDQRVKTYSIGFDDSSAGRFYNELPFARQVANLFNTEHHEIVVEPNTAALLPKLLWHLDEPIADTAFITTYLVSEFARKDVTVILSGVGGDELFGGYRRYLGEFYSTQYRRLPQWLRRNVLQPIGARMPSDRHSTLLNYSRLAGKFLTTAEEEERERYSAYVGVFDRHQRSSLLGYSSKNSAIAAAFEEAGEHGDYLSRLFAVDAATQLPDDLLLLTDKMSMAVSLECRVPLLDTELVELAARMPAKHKIRGRELKYVLKESLKDLLPREILYRKKRGFGAPMGAWIRHELAPLLESVLSRESVERRSLFNWDAVSRTIAQHQAQKADHTDHLLALMNLELWMRMYIDGLEPGELVEQLTFLKHA